MFNIRLKRFRDMEQIQVFSIPIMEKQDKERLSKYNPDTGEVCPTNRKMFYEPFDNEFVIGYEIHDRDEECVNRSVRRTKNKIYDIARSNDWHWFVTLTFNPDKVDSFDYDDTTKKLSKWLNNMRAKCPDMKYIVVPEPHPTSGRWHFHGLFYDCDALGFVDSGKIDDKGRIVYNVGSYRYGWSTATRIGNLEQACSYISKYTTKELMSVTYSKKRYWASKNVNLPEEEFFTIKLDDEELLRIKDIAYQKRVTTAYMDVTYLEVPIYTTNSTRFVTIE